MKVQIRHRSVRVSNGLDYSILFVEGALLFVMVVGDDYVKRFVHMVSVEI